MCRVGEEEGLRNIERLILSKYTYFWWMSIRAERVRRATFLGRVFDRYFPLRAICYTCVAIRIKVQLLDTIRF